MNDELKHVGILGMKWGRRQGPKLSGAAKVKARSTKSLKKDREKIAEYNAKIRAAKVRKISKKKLNQVRDEEYKTWSLGKKVAATGLATVGMYAVLKFVSEGGAAKLIMKAALHG